MSDAPQGNRVLRRLTQEIEQLDAQILGGKLADLPDYRAAVKTRWLLDSIRNDLIRILKEGDAE